MDIVKKLTSFFKDKKNIEMAFLFGSETKGRAMSESDVDIAVWFKDKHEMEEVDSLWNEIDRLLGRNTDLIVLNQARPTIAWAAMRGKKLLIRNYWLYLKKMLEISREAEDMQDFTIDLWNLRRKIRGSL